MTYYTGKRLPKSLVCSRCLIKGESLFFFSWQHPVACRISVPLQGIKLVPPAVEAQSLNPWTAKKFPKTVLIFKICWFHLGAKSDLEFLLNCSS